MPSQFDSRDESDIEPRDTSFSVWLAVFSVGVGLFILVDRTAGIVVAVIGAIGFIALAVKRGVGDLPDGGGSLPW